MVCDDTDLAAADPMNVPVAEAKGLALRLLEDRLAAALRSDRFFEGAKPPPSGQRAQGPFMISLGALADRD